MRAKSFLQFYIQSLFFLTVFFHDQAVATSLSISPTYPNASSTYARDVSADGQQILYSSATQMNTVEVNENETPKADIFLVNRDHTELKSITSELSLAEGEFFDAVFAASDSQVLLLKKHRNESRQLIINGLSVYDIAADKITNVDDLPENLTVIESASHGQLFYLHTSENAFELYTFEPNTLVITEVELTDFANSCISEILTASHSENLVLRHSCDSQLNLYSPDTGWRELGRYNTYYSHYVALSGDGQHVVFYNEDQEVEVWDISQEELDQTFYPFTSELLEDIRNYDVRMVNQDASVVLFREKLSTDVYDVEKSPFLDNQHIVAYHLEKKQMAFLTFAQQSHNEQFSYSQDINGNYLTYLQLEADVGFTLFEANLDAQLFTPELSFESTISVASDAPLSAQVTIENPAPYGLLTRTNLYTLESDVFLVKEDLFSAQDTGLHAQNYQFSYAACNTAFICTETPVSEAIQEIADFSSTPALSLSYVDDDESDAQPGSLTISSSWLDNVDYVNLVKLGEERRILGEGDVFRHSFAEHSYYAAQYCKGEPNQLSCGRFSEPLGVMTPKTDALVSVKVLPDFSGVGVRSHEKVATSYRIFRNLENQQTLIYEGNSPEYIDSQNLIGQTVSYTVLSCNDLGCARAESQQVDIKRQNYPVSINDVQSTFSGVQHNLLTFSSRYHFDAMKLERVDLETREREMVAELSGYQTEYLDETTRFNGAFLYILSGCYLGECEYSVTREVDPLQFQPAFALPGVPKNVSLDKSQWFLGGELSWDAVPGADGYEVTIHNNGRFRSSHELEGENNTRLAFPYSIFLGQSIYIEVKSYVDRNDGGTSKIYSEVSARLSTDAFSAELPRTLQKPVFSATRRSHDGVNSVFFHFEPVNIFDRYFVHWRESEEGDYHVAPLNYDRNSRPNYIHSFERTFEQPAAFHYKLQACNDFLQSCTFFDNEERVVFYPYYDFSEELSTPQLSWGEQGQLEVAPQHNENYNFSWIEISMSDRFSGRGTVVYSGEVQSIISLHLDGVGVGDDVFIKTRFCIADPGGWLIEEYHCTEFGEPAVTIVPESYRTAPEMGHIAFSLDVDLNETPDRVVIQGVDYQSEQDLSRPDAATFVRVWRGVGQQALTEYVDIDFSEYTNNENHQIYVDTDIQEFQYVRYQLQFCNGIGCSRFSDVKGIALITSAAYAPETPVITRDSRFENQTVKVATSDLVDVINIRWGNSPDSYRRESEWQLADYLSNEGILSVALNSETVWVTAQACVKALCSAWSAPFEVPYRDRMQSQLAMTGDAWLSVGNIYSTDHPWVVTSRSYVGSRYGEVDTNIGELRFREWFYLASDSELNSRAYLKPDANHNCQVLFQQGLRLSDDVNRRLFGILYTGNGCSEYQELELFQYYIISDYSAQPQLLEDIDSYLGQWREITLQFNEDLYIQVSSGGQIIFVSDAVPDLEVFALTQLSWQTAGESALASVTAVSGEIPVERDASINPWADFDGFLALHPTAFVLSDSYEYGEAFSINLYLQKEQQFQFVSSYEFSGTREVTPYFVTELEENSEQLVVFNRCNAQQCGPYYSRDFTLPEYRSLSGWDRVSRATQNYANELTLNLQLGWGYPDTVTFLQKNAVENDFVEVSTESYLEVLERSGSSTDNSFIPRLQMVAKDLNSEFKYQFQYRVCNHLGCVTSDASRAFGVPIDSDGDGIVDENDSFPNDNTEWQDTDEDGVGNNEDNDDDNDGLPDAIEVLAGLDPESKYDALYDLDGDSYNNIFEFLIGSDLADISSTPLDSGKLVSFEEEENYALTYTGKYRYKGFAFQGERKLQSGAQTNKLTITIDEDVEAGSMFFAAKSWADFDVAVSVDGMPLTVAEMLQTYTFGSRVSGWSVFEVIVPEAGQQIEMTFDYQLSHVDGALDLDAIYLPGNVNGAVAFDYNGDGRADPVMRDAKRFVNYVKDLGDGEISHYTFGKNARDIPVSGDFDGDGKADIAVRRPSNKTWYILRSSDNEIERHQFGLQEEDIPVPADYDGDGITDIAVRRPSTFMWYIKRSSDGEITRIKFGKHNLDIPVPADYDGDGQADVAVRRASNTTWYILRSSDNEIERHIFGRKAEDIPVPADYDGDGKADLAVRRPSSQMWYIKQSSDQFIQRHNFGRQSTDLPVVADYDGDGKADIAVRRAANFHWYILNSFDDSISREIFGKNASYIPLQLPVHLRMALVAGDYAAHGAKTSSADEAVNDQAFYEEEIYYDRITLSNEQ